MYKAFHHQLRQFIGRWGGISFLCLLVTLSACGKKGDENKNNGPNNMGPDGGCMDKCGGGPNQTQGSLSIDLSSAMGLAVTDTNSSTGLVNVDIGNLVKITSTGVTSAIKKAAPEGMTAAEFEAKISSDPSGGANMSLPGVVILGFSPTKEVYVLFERPFQYKVVDDPTVTDPWKTGSGYTCQLFKLKSKLADAKVDAVKDLAETNLECVTNQHDIPTWDRSSRLMQFDGKGNMYFPAQIPGTGKQVFYAYDPTTGSLSEKVNSNICFRDISVTKNGGIFYTGTSSSGSNCNGTSFFRYISNSNSLVEIARDWWEFTYDSFVDPEDPDNELLLFYGPDPDTASGLPSWNTACLYRYDPSADQNDRATRIATCLNDIWGWVDGRDVTGYVNGPEQVLAVREEQQSRCTSHDQVFIGGSGISQLQQDSVGTIFVAGELKKKLEGKYKCDMQVDVAHCSTLNPTDHPDEATCTAAGGTWVAIDGWCDGDGSKTDEAACVAALHTWRINSKWYGGVESSVCGTDTTGWTIRGSRCEQPSASTSGGDGWTTSIKGLAYVDPDSASGDEKLMKLLSDTDEIVTRFWIIQHKTTQKIYYASSKSGTYYLKQAQIGANGNIGAPKVILENYEVYNLSADPSDKDLLLFDGLYFADNGYRFGTIDPSNADPSSTLAEKAGLTGQVKTLIVLPSEE